MDKIMSDWNEVIFIERLKAAYGKLGKVLFNGAVLVNWLICMKITPCYCYKATKGGYFGQWLPLRVKEQNFDSVAPEL